MKRKRKQRLDCHLAIPFESGARALPARDRPHLLDLLRDWRCRPERVFWVLDGETGRWGRL